MIGSGFPQYYFYQLSYGFLEMNWIYFRNPKDFLLKVHLQSCYFISVNYHYDEFETRNPLNLPILFLILKMETAYQYVIANNPIQQFFLHLDYKSISIS